MAFLFVFFLPVMANKLYHIWGALSNTPFTRSSKHRANMKHAWSIAYTKQSSSKHRAGSSS